MNEITFNGGNFVGREIGYSGFTSVAEWRHADEVTQERFAPLSSFPDRFAAILDEVRAMGFEAMDLWTAQLHPRWATPAHIEIACDLLRSHGVELRSIGGRLGDTREDFDRTCRLAEAVGAGALIGLTTLAASDPDYVRGRLDEGELVLGYENHPERTPAEVLEKVPADGAGRIGVAVDTGWWGSHDYDAERAIRELGERIVYVHLKDVRGPGAHVTCRFGDGIVPLEGCVATLREIGYEGPLSVEHEPPAYDPKDEIVESLEMLHAWLAVQAS